MRAPSDKGSAQIGRLEVVETGRRRRWSEDEKLKIVLESLQAAMIPIASGVRVWIATRHTDMRRGMNSLALLVQEAFRHDPHGGDLYVFRGKSGKLIKIIWHDGLGMSLYAKRLERGRFLWPSPADGVVTITPAQLGYLLEGID